MNHPTADDIEAAIIRAANQSAAEMMASIKTGAAGLPTLEREALELMYATLDNTAATKFEEGARWCLKYLTQAFQPAAAPAGKPVVTIDYVQKRRRL